MQQANYHLGLNRDTGWQMKKPHFHGDVEILLSLSGSGEFFIENELYSIRAGSLFLLNEATIHKSIVKGQYLRYVLHVNPETLREVSTRISDILSFVRKAPVRCIHLDSERASRLGEKMEELTALNAVKNAPFGSDIRRTLKLGEVVLDVVRLFMDEGAEPEQKLQTTAIMQMAPVLQYIQHHLKDPISLDILMDQFLISKYYLCHAFKAATGLSVMEYVINCRILKAQELLREGMRVQSVGERTGFSTTAHFIRTFRNFTGVSPKRYAMIYLELGHGPLQK